VLEFVNCAKAYKICEANPKIVS